MEIELKLALHPRHAARIRRHPLLHTITPQQRALLSIYFDTPKFDLMRRGIALRMRRVDDQWIQALKAETRSVGALTSRPEWEMAVADGSHPDFSILPQTALDLLSGIKKKHIVPVFTTKFHRTSWQIGDDTAQAEVALDRGKIHAEKAYQDICEVEIELKYGAAVFLFDVAAQLLQQVPLHIESRSKAERGYILSGAANLVPTKAVTPMIYQNQIADEAWNAILQAALVQLTANVSGFLEHAHDTEYLHQIRVALRRLRTGALLAKSLGRTPPEWDQSLRQLMRVLNPARDWDVFRQEILPNSLIALGESSENAAIENATLVLIHDAAAHARQQAQAWLHKPVFTRLVLDIGRNLLATPIDAQAQPVKAWAEMVLDQRWHTLYKRCRSFPRLDPVERHMVRIAAKKMRYAADAFAPLYGKRASHFITALSALQDELGYANDLRVGMQLLHRLSKQSAAAGFDLGRIHGALECEAASRTHSSKTIWRRLARSKLFWR